MEDIDSLSQDIPLCLLLLWNCSDSKRTGHQCSKMGGPQRGALIRLIRGQPFRVMLLPDATSHPCEEEGQSKKQVYTLLVSQIGSF